MSGIDLIPSFLLGLLGSTHCLGMCSAFVICLSARQRHGARAWQAARLASYTVLGGVLGSIGMALRIHWDQSLGRGLMGLAALFMMGMGLAMIGLRIPTRTSALLLVPLQRLLNGTGLHHAAGLGWLTAYLPCGLLYAALLRSAVAPGPVAAGALHMLAFGLGTVPALSVVGWLVPWMRTHLPVAWPRLAGASVVVLGLLTAAHALLPATSACCCH